MQQNASYGKDLGNWYSYFSHSMGAFFLFSSHPVVYLLHGKCMGFLINFPQNKKTQQNPSYWEGLGNWYSYFSHSIGAFFHQTPILWYSTLHGKCMGFLINFQQHGKIQQKPLNGESLGNFHIFFIVRVLFSIRFPFYGILQYMRNVWVSPSISHSMGKCNKTLGKSWEIGNHTFPIVWVHFSDQIPIL